MERIVRWGPLSGLAFAVLFGVGSGLWVFDQPARGADTQAVLTFFEGTSNAILIGGTLSLVSLVFLVWFGTVVRARLDGESADKSGLGLVAFAGTLLLGGVGLAAETINMAAALSAEDGQLNGDTAQVYFDLTYAFGAHAAGVAMALVALPVAVTSILTGRVVPRPVGWVVAALGVVMLTPAILHRIAFLLIYATAIVLIGVFSVHLHRSPEKGTT